MAGVATEFLNLDKYKTDIHRTLIARLDLEKLSGVEPKRAREVVAHQITSIIAEQGVPLSLEEQDKIHSDLLDEVFGLGPIEALLRDPKISDILINGKDNVFVERGGKLQRVETRFRD